MQHAGGRGRGAPGRARVAKGAWAVESTAEHEGIVVPKGASVIVQSGFYEGLEVVVDRDWMVIGRGRSADVVIAEATISRAHAAIGYAADGFFVQDLGSTNGTMVNGARIDRHSLKPGDRIQMGRLVLGVTLP